ncbi:MAG: hypothetical protein GF344_02425 [Chitinivibrionales bacterium]|nr:hypothetical protein [Chitinivibrionales bacterium]MBD3355948.1 hypothetical protein [Chitinivibrionales bacterium]
MGRKNYLFKGSEKAAQRGAIIYLIIATANMHRWDPHQYIETLLKKLPSERNAANITNYLPYNMLAEG